MEIKSVGYKNSILLPLRNPYISNNQNISKDSFEHSAVKGKQLSFNGSYIKNLFETISKKKTQEVTIPEKYKSLTVSDYHKELSKGLKEVLGKDIPPENLLGILSPEEFRNVLPDFNADNFLDKNKNIDKGIYIADLDCETNFTKGGQKTVTEVLDEIVERANNYSEKTGNNFIFALADRDTLDSVRHVIRLIGENPQKYQNIKFVPAIKMSYTHEAPNSQLNYENCNFIVYGINPFSGSLSTLIERTNRKRKRMMINFIREVNKLYPEFSYTLKEFAKQNKFFYKRDFAVSNLYWRAREYAETKGETEMKSMELVPYDVIKEAEGIISELGKIYVGSGYEEIDGTDSDIIEVSELNKTVKGVFEKYSTHINPETKELVSSAENIYEDIISCLCNEKHKPVMAFAAPYYLCHDFDCKEDRYVCRYPNVVKYMETMKANSKGMLIAFQSVVPMYALDKDLSLDTIKRFNDYIRRHTDLYEVGGSFIQRLDRNEKISTKSGKD